jgi:hypothetical protein
LEKSRARLGARQRIQAPMTAGYRVLFDIAREPQGEFLAFLALCAVASIGMFALGKRTPVTNLMRIGWFVFVFSLAAYNYWMVSSIRSRLEQSLSDGALRTLDGLFVVPTAPSPPDVYQIGSETLTVRNVEFSPAMTFSRASALEKLDGRCVRAQLTENEEIVWLGVHSPPCDPT